MASDRNIAWSRLFIDLISTHSSQSAHIPAAWRTNRPMSGSPQSSPGFSRSNSVPGLTRRTKLTLADSQSDESLAGSPVAQQADASSHGWVMSTPDGLVPTCASAAFGCLFVLLGGLALHQQFYDDMGHMPQPILKESTQHLKPTIIVSLAWSALYFCFLQAQGASAFWVHRQLREKGSRPLNTQEQSRAMTPLSFAKVKYGVEWSRAGLIFVMDRSVGNMLEQSPPFLLGLWLYAMIESPTTSARLGWAWLLLRALYPFAFARRPTPGARSGISILSAVTWPSYVIVWSMLFGAARACW